MSDAPKTIWAVHWNTDGAVLNGGWADTVRHFGGGVEYVRADAHEATIAALREALKFYADENNNLPSEGPWGINSTDFGLIARAALAKETNNAHK